MNLKKLMDSKHRVGDAKDLNIIVYGGASTTSGMYQSEQDANTGKKFERFLAQNEGKISTLDWFMHTMNDFAAECNCVVEYSVSNNKNLVDCYLLGAGRITFAIVQAPTQPFINKLNTGQAV